ncbi:MAG: hypothetical protein ACI88A_003499 [Paraglaciecola sp.]
MSIQRYTCSYLRINLLIFPSIKLLFNAPVKTTPKFKPEQMTMMKLVKLSIAILTTTVVFAGTAHADVNSDLQNICIIVKADDKGELRKKMKKVQNDYKLKLQDYYTGISCGGQSLIRTAFLAKANEAGQLMVKKMPKSQLNTPEHDGLTLRAWASEQGLMDSPIALALNERI